MENWLERQVGEMRAKRNNGKWVGNVALIQGLSFSEAAKTE
jgi:hypothetical protein